MERCAVVVHAHGGPSLGEPKTTRADEDIKRWAITVQQGHAWAGSVFRQGGFAVTTAAEDTERVRRIFIDHVAKPLTSTCATTTPGLTNRPIHGPLACPPAAS